MNARSLLAETLDARSTLCTRWKMDMRKLRDRVAHRFVRNTFCAIAAVDVGNANAANRRRTRCSKRFNSITEDDDKLRRKLLKQRRQRRHAATNCRRISEAPRFARALHDKRMHTMSA
jgi:hypothetical protein